MTSDANELFLIYDNKDQTDRTESLNSTRSSCSPLGVCMLSESNGTSHTKAKYFGQLYVFQAWFPYLKYMLKTKKKYDRNE
jgi:hypothetical protein